MDRLRRDVILIRLIESLRQQKSWCGETHVQKATYLLQEMVGAPTGFEFILYKHGPFSFELRDELSAMRADGLVRLQVQDPEYGPSIVPEPAAEALRQRFPKTLRKNEPLVKFVVDKLGSRPVVELERLATAYYVWKMGGKGNDIEKCAERINSLKRHIPLEGAKEATRIVQSWEKEAEKVTPGQDRTC